MPLKEGLSQLSRDFVGVPSLRELALNSARVPDIHYIGALFASDTPHLKVLSIAVDPVAVFSTASASLPRQEYAQIKELKLTHSKRGGLAEWLVSPASPVYFTALVGVEINSWENRALVQLLRSACPSTQRLQIFGSSNRVQRIVLHVALHSHYTARQWTVKPIIDALAADAPMSALQAVEARMEGPVDDDFRLDLDSIRSYFSNMGAKGLLVVTDYRGAGLERTCHNSHPSQYAVRSEIPLGRVWSLQGWR
ncbi:hypothetical protein DFH09DRAFT_1102151 [Mycena vulgaris]|nr:hypothetical protein DFH09DRAFT_1102151 [Mycena vulgaris]